jgi:hypothetical protein
LAIWLGRELVGSAVEAWMVHRAARLSLRDMLHGAVIPLAAGCAMFATLLASREALPGDVGPAARLMVLGLIGAAVYFACVALLQRQVLIELGQFVRAAFRKAQPD